MLETQAVSLPASGAEFQPPPCKTVRPRWPLVRGLTAGLRLLPDFIIIGTQRGGTTSLYKYLCSHPDIGAASRKEVHYFDRSFSEGTSFYRSFFPLAAQRAWWETVLRRKFLTGEASPYYLYHPLVPQRVQGLVPNARFLAVLRNPVDRAFSQYQMVRRRGWEPLSFEEALDREQERLAAVERLPEDARYKEAAHRNYSYTARGRYAEQLERWFGLYPREQFLILNSERFYADTAAAMDRVLQFLGMPSAPVACSKPYNKAEYSGMTPATRQRLNEYFAPENERLFRLLGERFDWGE